MQSLEPIEYLNEDVHGFLLAECAVRLGLDVVVKVTMFAVLHYQVVILLRFDALVQPHHVLVLYFRQNSPLRLEEFLPLAT